MEYPLAFVSPRVGVIVCFSLLVGSVSACGAPDADPSVDLPSDEPVQLPRPGAEPAWRPADLATTGDPDDPLGLSAFVAELARARSTTRYEPPRSVVDGTAAAELSYDRYRNVRFRRDAAPWGGNLPFEIHLDHPGGGFDTPVRVHLVSADDVRSLTFDRDRFEYGGGLDPADFDLPAEAGHAGFRVLHAMNDPDRLDEVISFRGASYFRLVGPSQVYGASARGVALGVGEFESEEFPEFTEFWIVRPEPGDSSLVIHALLDGPSVTGAYRFELHPGRSTGGVSAPAPDDTAPSEPEATRLDVDARLFARRPVIRVGVAPLTSMYLHGVLDPPDKEDFRPRVHDSEGLIMETHAGERIWRPLTNPPRVRITELRDRDPHGFGLAQRSRKFEDYLDLNAEYHRRPGLWVEPVGEGWGEGGVLVAELPTEAEFVDNIVAFWAPDDTLRAGEMRRVRYRIHTFDDRAPTGTHGSADDPGPGRVVRTRIGQAGLPGQADPAPPTHRRVVVDFEGGRLNQVPEDREVEAIVYASTGSVRDIRVERLPGGGRRATWILEGEAGVPSDMRVFLRSGPVLTETWSHLLDPPDER